MFPPQLEMLRVKALDIGHSQGVYRFQHLMRQLPHQKVASTHSVDMVGNKSVISGEVKGKLHKADMEVRLVIFPLMSTGEGLL